MRGYFGISDLVGFDEGRKLKRSRKKSKNERKNKIPLFPTVQ